MGPMKDIKDFNPFPGLRPFTPEDRAMFFGRETESDEVISKLLKNRYISVIGAAGCGKSSLINSGIVPKINDMKVMESSVWRILTFSPGNDPLGNLARIFSKGIAASGNEPVDKEIILTDLTNGSDSFSELVRKYFKQHDGNVLLIIDQFEELFRYNTHSKSDSPQSTANKFVDFLLRSLNSLEANIFIIVSMRSEYIGDCSHYKGLTMLINNSNYLVPEMEVDTLRDVITSPVKLAGAKIDAELVETLLSCMREQHSQLLVLQHALMRTWLYWSEHNDMDKQISKSDYESTGSLGKAINQHAEKLYEELSQRGKEICSILFKTITRKSSENKGLRHPADASVITTIAACSTEELNEVVGKFSSLSFPVITTGDDLMLKETTLIDLRNENLITLWNRLKEWVDNEAFATEMYLRLSDASALYQQGKTGLFRPPDLQIAIKWRDEYKPTLTWAVQYNPAFERAMVFLRTSEKAFLDEEQTKLGKQKKNIKRNRQITRILGLAVFIALGLILVTSLQKSAAEKKIVLSENKRIRLLQGIAVADSFAIVAAQEAEAAKEQKIAADIQKSLAEKTAEEALRQRNSAYRHSDSVKRANLKADQNTRIAIEQRNAAQQQRMISLGKSMSLKSLQINGQKDLQTLVAYQAYLFNKRNNGPDNEADIYAGLYNVAMQYGSINVKSYKGQESEIKSIAFLPGKKEFFTSGNDGRVLKWSMDKKDQTLQVIYSGSDIIEVLAVSPDASWLACGSSNSSIRMIPLKGNNIAYDMQGHKGGIKSLIFSYDGKYLYSAALDGKVLKWDIAARTSINVSNGSMEITSIDVSSRGNYLAGISTDGNVVVWNPEQNSDNFRIETTGKNIKVVRFNPQNNLLALGDIDGNVELWDISLRKKLSEVKAHNGQISDIQFNTTLNQMATSGNDRKLKLFNIKNPTDLTEPPVTLADNDGLVLVMQFSPDGQMIISGESGGGMSLKGRPSHVDYLVSDICNLISRNMTQEEWNVYVAKDLPLEKTCLAGNYNIKVEPIKAANK
jgi:WD40 repeat protein